MLTVALKLMVNIMATESRDWNNAFFFLPWVCKVHEHAILLPGEVDTRNALCLARDLRCAAAVASTGYFPPLGSFVKLWFDYTWQDRRGGYL